MAQLTKYISLDVHKDTIAVAVAEDGRDREVRFQSTITNTPEALHRLVARLAGAEVEPDRVADDLGREPVAGVRGLGRRDHVEPVAAFPPAGNRSRPKLTLPSAHFRIVTPTSRDFPIEDC